MPDVPSDHHGCRTDARFELLLPFQLRHSYDILADSTGFLTARGPTDLDGLIQLKTLAATFLALPLGLVARLGAQS